MEERKMVYICSTFSGDVEGNTVKARRYSRFAVDLGAIPIAPHLLLPQYMEEETERDLAIQFDLEILKRCDELWVFGAEERLSDGMEAELDAAKDLGMVIHFFTVDMKEDS